MVTEFASALMASYAISMAVSPQPKMRTSRLDSWERSLYFDEWNTSPLMFSIPEIVGLFGSTCRPVQIAMCVHSKISVSRV